MVKTIEESIEKYFIKYKRRFSQKSKEDALRATRSWIEGLTKGSIDKATRKRIDKKLKELQSA